MQWLRQVGQQEPERADVVGVVDANAADVLRGPRAEIGHGQAPPEVDGPGGDDGDGPGIVSGLARIRDQVGVSDIVHARFVDGNIPAERYQIERGRQQLAGPDAN